MKTFSYAFGGSDVVVIDVACFGLDEPGLLDYNLVIVIFHFSELIFLKNKCFLS
jgi:hypothetical protein